MQVPQPGDAFGRYRLEHELGRGGMGVVYAASDTRLNRPVALKVIAAQLGSSHDFLQRFAREAALLARVRSPRVVQILDYGEVEGRPYIATQYVAGGDVGHLLKTQGPMPPDLALQVAAQVADALADAHRAGVVHRDVKPGNVLLRDPGARPLHAYLCDFGIARAVDENALTQTGLVVGTWAYLAPEVATGAPATPASDIYALGGLLWATLTGRAPYAGTDAEVALAHQHAPIPQLELTDDLAREVNRILTRCLAKDPQQRYGDAASLRVDLESAAGLGSTTVRALPTPTPVTTPPGGPLTTSRPRRRRRIWIAAAATLAVLTTVGTGLAVTRPWESPSDGSAGASDDPDEPTDPPARTGPVTGDLDNDGYGDLQINVVGSLTHVRTIRWVSDGTTFTEGPARRHDLRDGFFNDVVGDFDGDGENEVLRSTEQRSVTVRGRSSDGTDLRGRVPCPLRQACTPYVGDLDGDGRDDLLYVQRSDEAKPGGPFSFLWVPSRDDGFARPKEVLRIDQIPSRWTLDVAIADVDGDGRDDLATIIKPGYYPRDARARLQVHLSGAAGLSARPPIGVFENASSLVAGDIDGDGADELLLTGRSSTDTVRAFRLEDGRLAKEIVGSFDTNDNDYSFYAVSDVDGDRRDDLVALVIPPSGTPQTLAVARSNGRMLLNTEPWATTTNGPDLQRSGPDVLGNPTW